MRKNKNHAFRNELNPPQMLLARTLLTVIFLLMFLPMWNVIIVSTSTTLESSASGIKLWWTAFSLEGYEHIFRIARLGTPLMNSIYVTVVGTIIQVALSALAGYVLIIKNLPGKALITSFILLTMMIPPDLTLISTYLLNRQLGLLNSYTGLILNGLISGFSILLMRNYFLSVPTSLAESARLDGASELTIFAKIYLPISIPGLATVFFLDFVGKWNSTTIPATLITQQRLFTLPLMLRSLIIEQSSVSGAATAPPNAVMAAVVVSALPLLVLYIVAQRFLLSGMTLGASKE